jgi:hypothetical protein
MSSLPENTHWIDQLLADNPTLAETAWRLTVITGLVSIEVNGGFHEAHLWHSAVGGRIFPSFTNASGVRRQTVASRHVTVECVVQLDSTRTGLPLVGGS